MDIDIKGGLVNINKLTDFEEYPKNERSDVEAPGF